MPIFLLDKCATSGDKSEDAAWQTRVSFRHVFFCLDAMTNVCSSSWKRVSCGLVLLVGRRGTMPACLRYCLPVQSLVKYDTHRSDAKLFGVKRWRRREVNQLRASIYRRSIDYYAAEPQTPSRTAVSSCLVYWNHSGMTWE